MAASDIRSETLKFRPIKIGDIPVLAHAEQELFKDPWTPGMLLGALEDVTGRHEILYAGDNVLGYYFLALMDDEAELHNIAVLSPYQNKGLGTYILEKIVNQCDAEGVQRLYLEVRNDNAAAIHLYEKMGFEYIGRRPGYYFVEKRDALIYMRTKHE